MDFALIFQTAEAQGVSGNCSRNLAVTRHPLVSVCDSDRLHIGPGAFMDAAALQDVKQVLDNGVPAFGGWVEDDVLYAGANLMLWYVPPAFRPMHFRLLGRRFSVSCWWPGLVMQYHRREGFSVAAYAAAGKPNRATRLYRAPLWNISRSGQLCLGSATGANTLDAKARRSWEAAIFDSNFSHSNSSNILKSTRANGYKDRCDEQYVEFIKAKACSKDRFYAREMVPLNRTLGGWAIDQ